MRVYDTIIIGGGQAGLSVAYFFRRYPIDYLILDERARPGGAWLDTWDGLQLFSPVQYSSLSGWMMPEGPNDYPGKNAFISYLDKYEKRYSFPIERPVAVVDVTKQNGVFVLETSQGRYLSKTLVSATGTSRNPFIPAYPQIESFAGRQIHSSQYRRPDDFEGQNVLIVGGGNSGAQILAEVSRVAHTQWVTVKPPKFLPDHVDGRYLFHEATKRYLNQQAGKRPGFSLGDIVMIESVKEAERRGVLRAKGPFEAFYEYGVIWPGGLREAFDAVIWCTGFKSHIVHLRRLGVLEQGRIRTKYTRSIKEPNLWLVGYGNWTGFASATIYGVGKTARHTAKEIDQALQEYALED